MGAQSVIPTISVFLADALCKERQFEEAERSRGSRRSGPLQRMSLLRTRAPEAPAEHSDLLAACHPP